MKNSNDGGNPCFQKVWLLGNVDFQFQKKCLVKKYRIKHQFFFYTFGWVCSSTLTFCVVPAAVSTLPSLPDIGSSRLCSFDLNPDIFNSKLNVAHSLSSGKQIQRNKSQRKGRRYKEIKIFIPALLLDL